jgi:2-polyprenyl-3-methyl-5-hydroxy-6-metoxy-1,4-benzoquinol methylase
MANPEDGFTTPVNPPDAAPEDLHGYNIIELDRAADRLQRRYVPLDGKGPAGTLAELCVVTAVGSTVQVLDGGCGTGRQLYDLMQQVELWHGVDTSMVRGHAVSDFDFRGMSRQAKVNEAYAKARNLRYEVANLQSPLRAERYDLIYSDEVLVHNEDPGQIILNFWRALKTGGVLYCDALQTQHSAITAGALIAVSQDGGTVIHAESGSPFLEVLSQEAGRIQSEPRSVYKITKPVPFAWLQDAFKPLGK